MLLSASFMMMGFGLLCIFDADLVWSLYETDNRLFSGKAVHKSSNWETLIMQLGSVLLVLGGIGLMVGLGWRPLG